METKLILVNTEKGTGTIAKTPKGILYLINDHNRGISDHIDYHLYAVSDELIKDGDIHIHSGITADGEKYNSIYYIYKGTRKIDGRKELFVNGMFADDCNKVIATTDPDLMYDGKTYSSSKPKNLPELTKEVIDNFIYQNNDLIMRNRILNL